MLRVHAFPPLHPRASDWTSAHVQFNVRARSCEETLHSYGEFYYNLFIYFLRWCSLSLTKSPNVIESPPVLIWTHNSVHFKYSNFLDPLTSKVNFAYKWCVGLNSLKLISEYPDEGLPIYFIN